MTHLWSTECAEQESLPNKDQKQSKRNYMSLLGRDLIAQCPDGTQLEAASFDQSPACGFRENDLKLWLRYRGGVIALKYFFT